MHKQPINNIWLAKCQLVLSFKWCNHLFCCFSPRPVNQSVDWSTLKAPKGEKPGPRSDPKSQLLATLIFANNPLGRILAFWKTTWWAAKLRNQSAANLNNGQKVKACLHLKWSFVSNSYHIESSAHGVCNIFVLKPSEKEIISATQVLTSARIMTICHNTLSWDTSKKNETMALSPLFSTLSLICIIQSLNQLDWWNQFDWSTFNLNKWLMTNGGSTSIINLWTKSASVSVKITEISEHFLDSNVNLLISYKHQFLVNI